MQNKMGFFLLKKRMKGILVYVLEVMLTFNKMPNYQSFNPHIVRNLSAEYFERYLSFSSCSYCTHSSVYRVFCASTYSRGSK